MGHALEYLKDAAWIWPVVSFAFLLVFNRHTPDEWYDLADKRPQWHAFLSLVKKYGLDPKGTFTLVTTILTGKAQAAVDGSGVRRNVPPLVVLLVVLAGSLSHACTASALTLHTRVADGIHTVVVADAAAIDAEAHHMGAQGFLEQCAALDAAAQAACVDQVVAHVRDVLAPWQTAHAALSAMYQAYVTMLLDAAHSNLPPDTSKLRRAMNVLLHLLASARLAAADFRQNLPPTPDSAASAARQVGAEAVVP